MYKNKRKHSITNQYVNAVILKLSREIAELSKKYGLRILLCLIVMLCIQAFAAVPAFAEENYDNGSIIEEQIKSTEADKISEQLQKYAPDSFEDILPGYDPQKILEDAAKGQFEFNMPDFLNGIVKYLFKELYLNINILIKLIVLIVLCSILNNLQTSFLSESVGELAFYVCYVVIVSVLITSFNTVLDLARNTIDDMVAFMHATIPVLVSLLVTGGNIASGGIFQPILIMIVEISGTILKNVFLPIIFLSTILSIVNNISDKIQISKLASFLRQLSMWALGLMLTVFIGVVSVQGSLGAVVDGVATKTAKFAINAAIPIAGKYLADASEAVLGCTLLIKNASGLVVMIGVIAICMTPLLKLFAILLLFRLTCIVTEPVAEKRITSCINEMASSLIFIIGIVASVVLMFLIAITALISAGNISTMIR